VSTVITDEEHHVMKRVFIGAVVAIGALLAVVAMRGATAAAQNSSASYFGFLLGTSRIAGVVIEVMPVDAQGRRPFRAYVCDGLGPPHGISIWFSGFGPVEVAPSTRSLSFPSVTGREQLRFTSVSDRALQGAFVDANGVVAPFIAYAAFDGAGIYQVTLDADLRYRGRSTTGDLLEGIADRAGNTSGTITTVDGERIPFDVNSLALAAPADLAFHGLPDYTSFAALNQVPGEYVAVIAPGGSHWFGRSGAVQLGSPGLFIIGLDKKEFSPRTR
jgi:hypothetical protein